jgi:hypothetical protein
MTLITAAPRSCDRLTAVVTATDATELARLRTTKPASVLVSDPLGLRRTRRLISTATTAASFGLDGVATLVAAHERLAAIAVQVVCSRCTSRPPTGRAILGA